MRGRIVVDPYSVLAPKRRRKPASTITASARRARRSRESLMLRHLEPAPVKPRRVVVVGAAGFVGVAVCRQLVAAGVETLPVTRASAICWMPMR